jgi:acyl CoA:acetate/3-ketoacid CoA transferase beta subunit
MGAASAVVRRGLSVQAGGVMLMVMGGQMDFVDRMKQVMSQGFETTRKGMEQAAGKARELGEKGVLRYEITKLEKEVERRFALLGSHVYRLLTEKGHSTVSQSTPEVKELMAEVKEMQERIEEKEKALSEVGRS